MEKVSIIHTDDDDDLIVSFAIPGQDAANTKNLKLLRRANYEFLLSEEDRGVGVSYDDFPDEEDDKLKEILWKEKEVRILSHHHEYALSVQEVDANEIRDAQRILKKMNFDGRFQMEIVEP